MATDFTLEIDDDAAPTRYDMRHVNQLTHREHVRRRPGMYIGGTDRRALHQLIREVLQALYDDLVRGRCHRIEITLVPGDWVQVTAGGATFPDGPGGLPAIEAQLTAFANITYGVGVTAVNYLSRAAWIEVRADGYRYRQTYDEGVPLADVRQVGLTSGLATGLTFAFQPDPVIFETTTFKISQVIHDAWAYAALFPGLRLTLTDARISPTRTYQIVAPRGVLDYLKQHHLPDDHHPPLYYSATTENDHGPWQDRIIVGAAVAFTRTSSTTIKTLLPTGITDHIGVHGKHFKFRLIRQKPRLADNAYGFVAVMRVLHPELEFSGSFGKHTQNYDLMPVVDALFSQGLAPA